MSKKKTTTSTQPQKRSTSPKPPSKSSKKPTKTQSKPATKPRPPVTPSEEDKAKPKAKKANIMRNPFISKVVVNMSLGVAGETLDKAKKILKNLTGQNAIDVLAKTTNRDFGLRKGQPMGCKVTLRGNRASEFAKRALDVKDFQLPASSVDKAGNVSFGISEHIQIPGVKYDPDLGIFGMDVCICTERPGFRIKRRRRGRHRIPQRHQISQEEAMTLLTNQLGVQFTTPELEEE